MDKRIAEWMAAVEKEMPAKRWKHTLGVVDSAKQLAERYGADPAKAEIAAIFHDVTKYWPVDRMRAAIEEEGAANDVLAHDKELWHAFAGAYITRRDYGIEDDDILNAVRYHTSGREGMSLLEKVVCLADYIEPGRDFPGVVEMRRLAETSLEQALLAGFDGTIRFLLEKGKRIYPLTIVTRNELLLNVNKGG